MGTGAAQRPPTQQDRSRGKTHLEYHQISLLKLLLLLDDVAAQSLPPVGLMGLHPVIEEAGVGEGAVSFCRDEVTEGHSRNTGALVDCLVYQMKKQA